jgi:iron complex transport system substrate-binding protein
MIDKDIRIVSLIPSATEIIAKLGLSDAIVGRSHECDYPPEIANRPICTQASSNGNHGSNTIHDEVSGILQSALTTYKIKVDVLEKLQPTHIIIQDQSNTCAVMLPDIQKAVTEITHRTPQIISL